MKRYKGGKISTLKLVKCQHKWTAICRASTKKAPQRDKLRNTTDTLEWNCEKENELPTGRLKVGEWKKVFHSNGNKKKAGLTILISDKIDFKDYYKIQRKA